MISHICQIPNPSTAHQDYGVILQIVLYTRYITRSFPAICQSYSSDFSQSRIRFLRRNSLDLKNNTASINSTLRKTSGGQIASIQSVLDDVFAAAPFGGGIGEFVRLGETLESALKKAGVSTAEFIKFAEDLGITIDVTNDSLRTFEQLAEAMAAHSRDIGFPTRLDEVEGFTGAHVERALAAAKNPKLEMKLKNMPVPLSAETVDQYMAPVLQAAKTGDFSLIKNMI